VSKVSSSDKVERAAMRRALTEMEHRFPLRWMGDRVYTELPHDYLAQSEVAGLPEWYVAAKLKEASQRATLDEKQVQREAAVARAEAALDPAPIPITRVSAWYAIFTSMASIYESDYLAENEMRDQCWQSERKLTSCRLKMAETESELKELKRADGTEAVFWTDEGPLRGVPDGEVHDQKILRKIDWYYRLADQEAELEDRREGALRAYRASIGSEYLPRPKPDAQGPRHRQTAARDHLERVLAALAEDRDLPEKE
jgi:hypothetical protein